MDDDNKLNVEELPEDIFGREEIARSMCELIVNLPAEEYSPFVLDGPWGCGKTVHARRIMKCFCDDYADTVKIIYWNASESDYSDNPLLMFVSLLYNNISTLDSCGKRAVKICSQILLGAFGGLASVGTQFINRFSGLDIKEIIQEAEETSKQCDCSSQLEQQFESILKKAGSEKEQVDGARELLQLVQDDGKELIVIIDELDRCRPDFALKSIEIIKHLFTHSNVKFLLVMNKRSLACSVKHIYGLEDENAQRYLNKYTKLALSVPMVPAKTNGEYCCVFRYFKYLLKERSVVLIGDSDSDVVGEFAQFVFRVKQIELREVEKLMSLIKIIYVSSAFVYPALERLLILFVSCLCTFDVSLTQRLYAREAKLHEVLNFLGLDKSILSKVADVTAPHCLICLVPCIEMYLAVSYAEKSNILNRYSQSIVKDCYHDMSKKMHNYLKKSLLLHK